MTLRSRGMIRNILKTIAFMMLGILIGASAGFGFHLWVSTKQASTPPVIRKQVITVTREIVLGEELMPEDIATFEIEENSIPQGAFTQIEEAVGKKAWVNLTPRVVLQPSLFYQSRPEIPENEQEIVLLKLPDTLQSGDYVDLRIQFPSGHDYCVLSHKQVSNLWQEKNMISVGLSEEERVRMGSALTDVATYERAYLYLTIYPIAVDVPDTPVRYPVSGSVQGLYEEVAGNLLPGNERKHLELALTQLKTEEKFLEAKENAPEEGATFVTGSKTDKEEDAHSTHESEKNTALEQISTSNEETEKSGQGGEVNDQTEGERNDRDFR